MGTQPPHMDAPPPPYQEDMAQQNTEASSTEDPMDEGLSFGPEEYMDESSEESMDGAWEASPTEEHTREQVPWEPPVHPSVLRRHSEHTGDTAPHTTGTTTQEVQDTLQGLQSALAQGFTEQGMLQGRVRDISNSFRKVFEEGKAEV